MSKPQIKVWAANTFLGATKGGKVRVVTADKVVTVHHDGSIQEKPVAK